MFRRGDMYIVRCVCRGGFICWDGVFIGGVELCTASVGGYAGVTLCPMEGWSCREQVVICSAVAVLFTVLCTGGLVLSVVAEVRRKQF